MLISRADLCIQTAIETGCGKTGNGPLRIMGAEGGSGQGPLSLGPPELSILP